MQGLTNLRSLSFDSNLLSTIPDFTFAGQSQLTNLGLSSNKLGAIGANTLAGLSNSVLKSLGLNGNGLSYIADGALPTSNQPFTLYGFTWFFHNSAWF